jgi:hypothetical protein
MSIVQPVKQGIKGITLHQPWGYAIVFFGMDFINQHGAAPIAIGSYLAIHNGKTIDEAGHQTLDNFDPTMQFDRPNYEPGVIIAIAKFGGNLTGSKSEWFEGPIGWKLEDVVAIKPVKCRGQQGLWDLPSDVLAQVRANFKAAVSK